MPRFALYLAARSTRSQAVAGLTLVHFSAQPMPVRWGRLIRRTWQGWRLHMAQELCLLALELALEQVLGVQELARRFPVLARL